MKNLFLFLFLLVVFTSKAQDNRVSGLNSRQFTKYWKVESESPDYKVTFQGDTAEIVSPKGLTLWRKEKMSGKVTIEYDACVVVESDGDRLSDLNCFWILKNRLTFSEIFSYSYTQLTHASGWPPGARPVPWRCPGCGRWCRSRAWSQR